MLAAQRAAAADLPLRPLVSVLTPVFNPPLAILEATLASVRAQTYERWEHCLVDGGSHDPAIRALLEDAAARDPRIKVQFLERNLGISENSNAAAALATGEFIVFLDHDDTLAPQALFAIIAAVNARPDADMLYFDEDKLSEDGRVRSEPFFKPDWSPELLLSANYLMHSALRRQLFLDVGGFDDTTDGAQDWDLALRCTERTAAIVHLPQVLYHWRQLRGSTAGAFGAKPYVFENQLRVVRDHLRRRGIAGADTAFEQPGKLRATWPTQGARVSIIIPTKEKVDLLRPCLTSLLRQTRYPDFEVILVDNGSQEAATMRYYAELAAEPRVRIIDFRQKFNYSAANNLGASVATGTHLLFLNNDIEILDQGWLDELVRWAELPEIGAVGAKLLYPDNRIQHAGVIVGMEGHASHIFWGTREFTSGPFGSTEWYRNYLAITGACLLVRRAVFDEVGGFDEGYQLVFSDIEFCLRVAQAGYRNLYTPFARLRHHEGGSRGQHIPAKDMLRGYMQMHQQIAAGDPYYNPNLTYAGRIPTLAPPGEEDRSVRLRRLCGVQDPANAASRHGAGAAPALTATAVATAPPRGSAQQPPLPYSETLDAAAGRGQVLHREEIYNSGPPNATANPEIVALLMRHCQGPVLDLGCGIGTYVEALGQRGLAITGLEVIPDYVARAQQLGRNVAFYDGGRIPFEDKSFGTAIAIEVLEHIPEWERSLREMIRVARHSVVISVTNIGVIPALSRHNVVPWHLLEATHLNFFTREILQNYLATIPEIRSEVSTYGEFRVNGEVFHNHVCAIIWPATPRNGG